MIKVEEKKILNCNFITIDMIIDQLFRFSLRLCDLAVDSVICI